jgi:hypothetical protein
MNILFCPIFGASAILAHVAMIALRGVMLIERVRPLRAASAAIPDNTPSRATRSARGWTLYAPARSTVNHGGPEL